MRNTWIDSKWYVPVLSLLTAVVITMLMVWIGPDPVQIKFKFYATVEDEAGKPIGVIYQHEPSKQCYLTTKEAVGQIKCP